MDKLYVGGIEVQVGDVLLVKGKRLISRLIRMWMKIYRKKLGLPNGTPIYNHAAMVIELWGNWYVAEALGRGITIRPFMEVYANRDNDLALLRPTHNYSPKEKSGLSQYVCSFSLNPTRYDFANFLYQMKKILLINRLKHNAWTGKTGEEAKKKLYCTEAVAWWTNRNRRIFASPASVNPLDIYINRGLKILHDGQSS